MKHLAFLLLAASGLSAATDRQSPATSHPAEQTAQKNHPLSVYSSYMGTCLALQLLKNDVALEDIDMEHFFRAFEAGMKDRTDSRAKTAKQTIHAHLQQQSEKRQQQLAEKAKKEGERFLAENSKKPDIKTTASGLQYRIDRPGSGDIYNKKQHGTNPTYTVKYTVRTLDGTVISDFTDETVEATDHSKLEGFDEGLSLMPVGAQWTLFLPSHLAFGEEHIATQNSILPANSALILQVELFDIKKGDETQTMYIGGLPFKLTPINQASEETADEDEE